MSEVWRRRIATIALSVSNPSEGAIVGPTTLTFTPANATTPQTVRIIDADGNPWDALYTLEQQADGSWKITGCVLKAVGQSA